MHRCAPGAEVVETTEDSTGEKNGHTFAGSCPEVYVCG